MEVRSLMQPHVAAADVLAEALASADRFDIASAFVTAGGIDHLRQWRLPDKTRLIARAGHGRTDPYAIACAVDELGIDVRLVAGPAAETFHPKLYLVHKPDRLHVLTGSGNLTGSGLTTNVEQFEWLTVPRGKEDRAQITRFGVFWKRGLPLADLRVTPWWDAWLALFDETGGSREDPAQERLDRLAPPMPNEQTPSPPEIRRRGPERTLPDRQIPGCLDRWLPDSDLRALVCNFFADAIERHHALYPKGWALLALDPGLDGRFRFQQMSHNVDRFRLRDDGALIVGIGDRDLATRLDHDLPDLVAHIDAGPYKTHDLTIPAVLVPRVLDDIRRPALELVTARRAAKPSRRRSAHRERAIAELERVTGRSLPRPDYS